MKASGAERGRACLGGRSINAQVACACTLGLPVGASPHSATRRQALEPLLCRRPWSRSFALALATHQQPTPLVPPTQCRPLSPAPPSAPPRACAPPPSPAVGPALLPMRTRPSVRPARRPSRRARSATPSSTYAASLVRLRSRA
jgi:hypothetical protein